MSSPFFPNPSTIKGSSAYDLADFRGQDHANQARCGLLLDALSTRDGWPVYGPGIRANGVESCANDGTSSHQRCGLHDGKTSHQHANYDLCDFSRKLCQAATAERLEAHLVDPGVAKDGMLQGELSRNGLEANSM